MSLPSIGRILLAQHHKRRDSLVDMNLHTMLNTTNRTLPVQYEVPLPLALNHDMNANGHYSQQNLFVPSGNSRIKSENSSDRGVSPHTSDHSSRYSSQTPQNSVAYQQIAAQLTNGMRYSSPQMQQNNNMPMLQHSYHPATTQDQGYQQTAGATMGSVQQAIPQTADQSAMDGGRASTGSTGLPKAFSCSTCAKGFARRSDLARHGATFRVSSLYTKCTDQ